MWLFHYQDGQWLFDQFTITIPEYAILTHRWRDPEERLFSDVRYTRDWHRRDVSGARKILELGKQTLRDGIKAFWIDTCCINKDSSAELQEAINSMVRLTLPKPG